MSERPSPYELWQQADGDRDEYRRLLREHGHLIDRQPNPATGGLVTKPVPVGRHGCVIEPSTSQEASVRDSAVLGEGARQ